MSSATIVIRGLFTEAWARRRRRRRIAAIVVALGALAVALVPRGGAPRVPVAPSAAALHLPRAPYVGVACPGAPNSIACDRVGVAVWLAHAPARLVATIGGRSVVLRDQHIRCAAGQARCDRFFTGYLTHAGLLDGALRVRPDAGRYRWFGRHPVTGTLRVRATYRGGRVEETVRRVALGPGWG